MVRVASDPATTAVVGVLLKIVVLTSAWFCRGVGQHRGDLAVDAGRMRLAGGRHGCRLAENPGGEGDRVGAEIQQRPAGQVVPHDPVIVGEVLAVVGDHRPDLAQRAGFQQLPDDVELRQEHRPQRLHEEDPLRGSQFGQFGGLARVQRHRLFDQRVLAGL